LEHGDNHHYSVKEYEDTSRGKLALPETTWADTKIAPSILNSIVFRRITQYRMEPFTELVMKYPQELGTAE
jgi:hypothetical protein